MDPWDLTTTLAAMKHVVGTLTLRATEPPVGAEPNPLVVDIKATLYISMSSMLGLLSAFASLLGSGEQDLRPRIILAYLLAGALVSAGLTFLLIAQYGFSYFLLGISIFAGYKAFDMLAMIGVAVSSLVKRILGKK